MAARNAEKAPKQSEQISTDDWRQAEASLGKLTQAVSAAQLSSVLINSDDAQAEKTRTANLDQMLGEGFSEKPDPGLLTALETPKLSPKMTNLVAQLREFTRTEELNVLKQAASLELGITALSTALKQYKSETIKQPRLLSLVKELRERLDSAKEELKALWQSSPEAWRVLGVKQLAEFTAHLEKGRLVRTPYVEEKLERSLKALEQSRAIFLHGETGSGKSELARLISQEISGEEPLVIRGYNGISSSEIFGHMSLKASDCERAAELPDKINQEIAFWQEKHPGATPEEQDQAVKLITERMLRANNSTISEYILGAIYKGARDGRVVLIDEANFIPPGLVAKINDILTKEPGEPISIPEDGLEPVTNKRVAIVMTGNININPQDPRYQGRFDHGPDQLERIVFIDYNFLPQAIDGHSSRHEFNDKQLFTIALTTLISGQQFLKSENGISRIWPHLQEKDGSGLIADTPRCGLEPLRLPTDAIEKLWNLSQLAAVTQRVFSGTLGKEGDEWSFQQSGGLPATVRTTRLISPRGMIRIVKAWAQDGFETDLDHFVFEHLIESSLDVKQKAYFYQLGQKCGFFQDQAWPQNPDYTQGGLLGSFGIKSPQLKSSQLKLFLTEEVLEPLFGPPPERSTWPGVETAKGEKDTKQESSHAVITAYNSFADSLKEVYELTKTYPILLLQPEQQENPEHISRKSFVEMWEFPDKALQYFLTGQKISREEFIAACKDNLAPGSAAAELLARAGWLDTE